jgi:hypothetical protein
MEDNPKYKGTPKERLALLLAHRERWANTEQVTYKSVKLQPDYFSHNLAGGVFANMTSPRRIVLDWLPSGSDDGHQLVHTDIGLQARYFMMDPEQDLLVLMEVDPLSNTLSIHLRTLLTNSPHPKHTITSSRAHGYYTNLTLKTRRSWAMYLACSNGAWQATSAHW